MIRINALVEDQDKQKLKVLADYNAGENESLMLRKLIRLAFTNPKKFGFQLPRDASLDLEAEHAH